MEKKFYEQKIETMKYLTLATPTDDNSSPLFDRLVEDYKHKDKITKFIENKENTKSFEKKQILDIGIKIISAQNYTDDIAKYLEGSEKIVLGLAHKKRTFNPDTDEVLFAYKGNTKLSPLELASRENEENIKTTILKQANKNINSNQLNRLITTYAANQNIISEIAK